MLGILLAAQISKVLSKIVARRSCRDACSFFVLQLLQMN